MHLPMLQGDMATGLKRAYFIPGADVSLPPQPRGMGPAELLLATGDVESKKPTLGLLQIHPCAVGQRLCSQRGKGKHGREVKPGIPPFHLSSPNPALSGSKPGGPTPSSMPLCNTPQPCTPPRLGEPVTVVDANKYGLHSMAELLTGMAGTRRRGTAPSRDPRGYGGVKLGVSMRGHPAGASQNELLP